MKRINVIQTWRIQVFHNMFIFSTIKSQSRLSCVLALILFPLGWSDDGEYLGKDWKWGSRGGVGGVVWRNKKLRGLLGYDST